MREKKQRIVFTFSTTEQAMAIESHCKKESFPGRMIPVPPEITGGCGLCWCCLPEEREAVENALAVFSLSKEAVYEIMLY